MRTRSITPLPALILGGALILTAAACGTAGPSASPRPSSPAPTNGPSAPTTPLPTDGPSAPSTPRPTPTSVPTSPRVTLDIADDRNVVAVINDRTGSLSDATSGKAAATMSVQWFKSIVENVDDSTIEVTWVGLPRDEEIGVEITETAGGLAIEITQASPPLNSDAEGSDRVLVLEFDEDVAAEDVEITFTASNPA